MDDREQSLVTKTSLLLCATDENQVPQSTLARSRSCISKPEFMRGGLSRARRDRCLRSLDRAAGGRARLGRLACLVGAGD
jgi:hypothetical protein